MNTIKKKRLCFYFQLHQPFRLTNYSLFDIDSNKDYFKGPQAANNQEVFDRISDKCYLPMADLMYKLSTEFGVKWSVSMSGTWIEQAEKYRPDVILAFQRLIKINALEILGETYYHSLASIKSRREFAEQVHMHSKKIRSTFALIPQVFRNSELIYNNEIANFVYEMGFDGMLAEGWNMGWRSSNFVYSAKKQEITSIDKDIIDYVFHRIRKPKDLKVLLRNSRLSDDIGARFNDTSWDQYPLTSEKYSQWLREAEGEVINLFMNLETFGELKSKDSGIFDFLYHLAKNTHEDLEWTTVSEAIKSLDSKDEVNFQDAISWSDIERDLSPWCSNKMQQNVLDDIFSLEEKVKEASLYLRKTPDKRKLLDTWRKLQTTDHLYYMNTKYWNEGEKGKFLSPYETPYQAFINYMNVLQDFSRKLNKLCAEEN